MVCRESSFQHIQKWASSQDLDDTEIKICVALHDSSQKTKTEPIPMPWLKDAINWCNKFMFEYIEVQLFIICLSLPNLHSYALPMYFPQTPHVLP